MFYNSMTKIERSSIVDTDSMNRKIMTQYSNSNQGNSLKNLKHNPNNEIRFNLNL